MQHNLDFVQPGVLSKTFTFPLNIRVQCSLFIFSQMYTLETLSSFAFLPDSNKIVPMIHKGRDHPKNCWRKGNYLHHARNEGCH